MRSLISPQHLDHLISESSLSSDEKRALREALKSGVDGRGKVADALEDHYGGNLAWKLDAAYEHKSTTAVHMWDVPGLRSDDAEAFLEEISTELEEEEIGKGRRYSAPVPDAETGEYLAWFIRTESEFRMVVTLLDVGNRDVVGITVPRVRVTPVLIVIPVGAFDDSTANNSQAEGSAENRAVRAYAGHRTARQAVMAVLRDYAGYSNLEADSTTLGDVASNLALDEEGFHELATAEDLDWYGVEGVGPGGDFSKIAIEAAKSNGRYEPLDQSNDLVSCQEAVENNERAYQFDFEHDDGYIEAVTVKAYFHQYPHVTFNSKTSLPAMEFLLDKIEIKLGEPSNA